MTDNSILYKGISNPHKIPPNLYDKILKPYVFAPIHSTTKIGNWGLPPKNAILMYHGVGEDPTIGFSGNVSKDEFRKDIDYLSDHAEIVPLTEIREIEEKQKVAITFDDGLTSFYTNALPILREYNAPATVFINPSFVWDRNIGRMAHVHGLSRKEIDEDQIVMSEDVLYEISECSLVRIGNHTKTHANLSQIQAEDELREEIVNSKNTIEERLGINVSSFAYPYGKYNKYAKQVVEEHHNISVNSSPDLVGSTRNFHGLPRIHGHEPHSHIKWELSTASDIFPTTMDPQD